MFTRVLFRAATKGGKLHPVDDVINRIVAMLRAKIEPASRVIKRQFGYVKDALDLANNQARIFTILALGNLFLARRRLLA